jgi:hypothetical protein
MAFCIPEEFVDIVEKILDDSIRDVESGNIVNGKPEMIQNPKASIERLTELTKQFGEKWAQDFNLLYEKQLLLKDKTKAINDAVDLFNGVEKTMKIEIKAKIAERLKNREDIIQVDELLSIIKEQLDRKYGIELTTKQTKELNDRLNATELLKSKIEKAVTDPKYDINKETTQQKQARLEYGTALALTKKYIYSLKLEGKEKTVKEIVKSPIEIGNISKALVASIDNSLWGNQGIAALFNPRTTDLWFKNFAKSFNDIRKGLKGESPTIATQADVFSRPNALNNKYEVGKYDLNLKTEEAYPTSLPERIIILGRFFKASSEAYNSGGLRLRADIADRMIKLAEKNGVDTLDPIQAEPLGNLVNGFTGRGKFKTLTPEGHQFANALLFSPKLLKGTFDTLTAQVFNKEIPLRSFAQKQAALNLLGMAASVNALMVIAESMNPGSVDFDPRGTHYGQIKVGNSYINVMGPYRPMIRTLSQIIPTLHNGKFGLWSKDKSGKWRDLADGKFGKFTALDVAEGFLEGKASPALSAILDFWRGRDFAGNKPTLESTAKGLVTPITIDNFMQDSVNSKVENQLLNLIIQTQGFNITTPE